MLNGFVGCVGAPEKFANRTEKRLIYANLIGGQMTHQPQLL